jgi:hypothetical protein
MIINFKGPTCRHCPFRIADYHEDTCVLYISGAKLTNKASVRERPEDCPFRDVTEITIRREDDRILQS